MKKSFQITAALLSTALVAQAEALLEVCALHFPNTGHQPVDLLAGVIPAKPADIAAHLLKPGMRTPAF